MATPRAVHRVTCLDNEEAAREQRLLTIDGSALAAHYTVPGQVVEAEVAGARAYFVVASPLPARPRLQLLLRQGAGAVADALAAITPGGDLAITEPFGPGFALGLAAGRPVVLCVSGTGMGAVRPVLHALAEERPSLDGVFLFYGVRTPEFMAFDEELEGFVARGLTLRVCLSDVAPAAAAERAGWVQQVLAHEAMDLSDAVVFVAGHREMAKALKEICRAAGLPDERYRLNF